MSDLAIILPNFDVRPYYRLLHSLEKHEITVADLVSVEPTEIARKCPLPLLEVRRLIADIVQCLQSDLKMVPEKHLSSDSLLASTNDVKSKPETATKTAFIATTDSKIDDVLGGGFATGYVTEVVGER
jgi:DNA repair protein RAD57